MIPLQGDTRSGLSNRPLYRLGVCGRVCTFGCVLGKEKELVPQMYSHHPLPPLFSLHLQDIPAHLSTPGHSGSTMATPQHPLSTSAPSQYAQLTPLAPLHTPVEMILSSRKYTPVQAPGEVDSYLILTTSPGLLHVL